ncbi:MAG: hypothetical protein QXG10_03885 [Candidatus Hadarchaeales archaeon]
MNEELARKVREAFEDALPYLARPAEVKEIVINMAERAESVGELINTLDEKASEVEDRLLKTDLKIVINTIEKLV